MAPPQPTKSQGMTFAEKQLQRHGWTEGKGLGRRENGISEAIKVKVKCDNAGIGHNSAEQFTFHWWDHVFNKTASSISVESDQDGAQVKKVTEDDTTVTNRKPRKALMNRDMLYGHFIKSATLLSGGETAVEKESSSSDSSDSSGDEDEKLDLSSATKLTDEDLVKICGGRTAHKGARHGLTMNAKLLRIEEQERAFLEKYGKKELKNESIKPSDDLSLEKERKKKTHCQEAMDEATQDSSSETTRVKKKRRKKSSDDENVINGEEKTGQKDKSSKKKRTIDNVPEDVNDLGGYDEDTTTSKKKNVVEDMTDDLNDHIELTEDGLKGSEKKKKKKKKGADEEVHDLEDQASSVEDEPPRKKKKKRKVKDNEDERTEESLNGHKEVFPSEEEDRKSSKKKKKPVNLNDTGEQEPDDPMERSKHKNKRQKENTVLEVEEYIEEEDDCDDIKKKKKKSKTKQSDHSLEEAVNSIEHPIKRKKKRKDKS